MSLSNVSSTSTILVIDDVRENRVLLNSQLKRGHYQVLNAKSGSEGLAMVRHHHPDLVLLDVMMPDIDGFEVCSILKNDPETAAIPIIMLTALRDVAFRIRGIESGADEFLSRPHNFEELMVRVTSLIQLKLVRDRLQVERNNLELLYNVSQVTMNHFDLEQLILSILTYTQKALGATKSSLIVTNNEGGVTHKILVRANSGISEGQSIANIVMSKGFAGWLWKQRRGDIIVNTQTDNRWVFLAEDDDPASSAIGVPLTSGDQDVLGLLILTHTESNYFRPNHLALLETISGHFTAALRNARLFDRVREEGRKLGAILAQSHDGIITTNEKLEIEVFNPAAEGMFHVATSDVIGKPIEAVEALAILAPHFAVLTPLTTELYHELDGRYSSVSVSPVTGVGVVAVVHDITERKLAAEQKLELERHEKERLRETFGRYISRSLLHHALSDSPELQRQKRWAVILFADLRNHTQMVANLPADEALELLNEFFAEMTKIINHKEGTIVDLIGDELEVGFNVPIDQHDAPSRAIKTAIEMQMQFNQLRPNWHRRCDVVLGLGIGIDFGDVVIGRVGSESRMNLAMVGEAVNTAHRLVDLAEDGQIVISNEFRTLLLDESAELVSDFHSMGHLKIKGINRLMELYRAELKRELISEEIS